MKEKFNYKKDLNRLKENYELSYLKIFNINNENLLNDLFLLSKKYNFQMKNEIKTNKELREETKKLYYFILNN